LLFKEFILAVSAGFGTEQTVAAKDIPSYVVEVNIKTF